MSLKQARRALERCLKRLAPAVRMAVLLRFHEGYSYVEMGRISLEEPATLQARVARAMPVLRQCIEAQGVTL